MSWEHPKDIPLDTLRPLVLEIAERYEVKGRDGFCVREMNACVGELKQRLGPDAGHFRIEQLAATLMNHAKRGRLRFNNSNNRGPRSFNERESLGDRGLYDRLCEPDWPDLSEACKARDGYRCRVCNAGPEATLEAHHRTYETMRTEEELDDLTTLCRKCHTRFHDV